MADTIELSSIISYSEDIADAVAPDLLPVRDYVAEVTQTRVMPKKSKPDEAQVEVTFYIPTSEYPLEYEPENAPDGVTAKMYVPVGGTRIERHRMKQFVQSINAPTGKDLDTKQWIGCTASVRIRHGEFQGVKKVEIESVKAA